MDQQPNIDQILNSVNGISQVSPNPLLLRRIKAQIEARRQFSKQQVWLAAASFMALVALNVGLFKPVQKTKGINAIANSVSQSNQLY